MALPMHVAAADAALDTLHALACLGPAGHGREAASALDALAAAVARSAAARRLALRRHAPAVALRFLRAEPSPSSCAADAAARVLAALAAPDGCLSRTLCGFSLVDAPLTDAGLGWRPWAGGPALAALLLTGGADDGDAPGGRSSPFLSARLRVATAGRPGAVLRVLELGCGSAPLPGLAAARALRLAQAEPGGAEEDEGVGDEPAACSPTSRRRRRWAVVLSDSSPGALAAASANAARNGLGEGSGVSAAALDWGLDAAAAAAHTRATAAADDGGVCASATAPPFDLLLGADVCYDPSHADALPAAVARLLARPSAACAPSAAAPRPCSPGGVALFAHGVRFPGLLGALRAGLRERGLATSEAVLQPPGAGDEEEEEEEEGGTLAPPPGGLLALAAWWPAGQLPALPPADWDVDA